MGKFTRRIGISDCGSVAAINRVSFSAKSSSSSEYMLSMIRSTFSESVGPGMIVLTVTSVPLGNFDKLFERESSIDLVIEY